MIVAVCDAKTGEAFSIELRAGERALRAFHHPFSYPDARREPAAAAA